MRPDWDSYFMKIASAVSERSTCDEIGHLMVDGHCVRTIHAETNAIIQAALHGISTRGSTCYVTHLPCINCTKALINAGIIRIVYGEAYRVDENAMGFLKSAGIELSRHQNGMQEIIG